MDTHMTNRVLVAVIFVLLFAVSIKFSGITGFAVVEKGETEDAGEQEKGNPNYGALKGTIVLVIKDDNKIISSEEASNQVINFVEKGKIISDWSLVKEENEDKYNGDLNNVDADGDESKCSEDDYETERKYYDEDDDDKKKNNEFYVYQVKSNNNGCFAAKLPPGDYDIYI